MSAKEMFEKLGYKRMENSMTIQYRLLDLQVRFWKESKYIELFGGATTPDMNVEGEEYYADNYKIFQAINKQVEELGWK